MCFRVEHSLSDMWLWAGLACAALDMAWHTPPPLMMRCTVCNTRGSIKLLPGSPPREGAALKPFSLCTWPYSPWGSGGVKPPCIFLGGWQGAAAYRVCYEGLFPSTCSLEPWMVDLTIFSLALQPGSSWRSFTHGCKKLRHRGNWTEKKPKRKQQMLAGSSRWWKQPRSSYFYLSGALATLLGSLSCWEELHGVDAVWGTLRLRCSS